MPWKLRARLIHESGHNRLPVVEHGRYHLDLRHPRAVAHLDAVVDRLVAELGADETAGGSEIRDPMGWDEEVYREVFAQMRACLERFAERHAVLAAEARPAPGAERNPRSIIMASSPSTPWLRLMSPLKTSVSPDASLVLEARTAPPASPSAS